MAAKIRTVAEKSPIEIQDPGFIEKTRMSISNRTQGNPGEVKKRKNKHTKKLEMTVPRLTVPCNDISELTAAPLPPTPFARRSQTHDFVYVGAGGTASFWHQHGHRHKGSTLALALALRDATQAQAQAQGLTPHFGVTLVRSSAFGKAKTRSTPVLSFVFEASGKGHQHRGQPLRLRLRCVTQRKRKRKS